MHVGRKRRENVLSVGVARGTGGELDEERRLAYVGGHALELESLEARPAEESRVLGGEAAEELGDVLVRVLSTEGLLLRRGYLRHGVLADRLMRWPVLFLAFGGLTRSVSDRAPTPPRRVNYSRSNLWSSA